MDLKALFDSMSEEQRNIQLGFDTATPLTHAFTSKRAVHALSLIHIFRAHETERGIAFGVFCV